mgnify:CR=1 FL=1
MNEHDLARQIVSELDRRLADISPNTSTRLAEARAAALAAHRRRRSASPRRAAAMDWLRSQVAMHRTAFKVGIPVAVAALLAASVLYVDNTMRRDALEVEAALLADELPIHAYTDPGFDAWLRHTSDEQ